MNTHKKMLFRYLIALVLVTVGILCCYGSTFAQIPSTTLVTPAQLTALAPDEGDLPNFVRLRPACDTWNHQVALLADGISLDEELVPLLPRGPNVKHVNSLYRCLYSSDGIYSISITIRDVGTLDAAQQILFDSSRRQVTFRRGTFNSEKSIGDESWCPEDGDSVLLLRAGRVIADIEGGLSNDARNSGNYPPFPHAALEAVAYQILLRASQQPELTGVSAEQATLAVNGHALPKGSLRVAGQTYVPVKAFAQAMGLTAGWNVKTGALTLTGPQGKTIALTAGSTAVGGGGLLQVPVLKQAGQPVMTLDDLLRLTGGRVTSRSADGAQSKA